MTVQKLGTQVPADHNRDAEEWRTEFRYFQDEPDEVEATFNIYPPTEDGTVYIGWYLEAVGLVTWHRADTLAEAEAWVDEQTVPWIRTDDLKLTTERKGCAWPWDSDVHSEDRVTVWHGEPEPLTLCGMHAQATSPRMYEKIRENRENNE